MNPTNVNNSAGVGGGSDAFEYYQSGASIEEVNAKFFSSSSGAGDVSDMASAGDNTDYDITDSNVSSDVDADGGHDSSSSDDECGGSSAGESDSANGGASRQGEPSEENLQTSSDDGDIADRSDVDNGNSDKKFTQAELDSIIGRRLSEIKGSRDTLQANYDSIIDDIAGFLGVDRKGAVQALRDAKYRREAESNQVDDVELYTKMKNLERRVNEFEKSKADDERKAFVDTVSVQLDKLRDLDPGIDFEALSKNGIFNSALREMYADEGMRADCVNRAYRVYLSAYGNIDDASVSSAGKNTHSEKSADQNGGNVKNDAQKDKINRVKKANARRAGEAAVSSGAVQNNQQFDYENMTADDFENIMKRVNSGEIIML